MSLNLTVDAPPIFLSKNYANKDVVKAVGVYTATSMQELMYRIFEMDPYSYWSSSGSSDGNLQTLNFDLYEGSSVILRQDIALIALLNTNLKDFIIYLSQDGGATSSEVYSVSGNLLSNYILDISAGVKSANFIRVYGTNTIVPNEEKKVGTVICAGLKRQMANIPNFPITRNDRENVKILQMGNGSENITRIKRSAASYSFFQATYSFSNLTYAEMVAMKTFRRENPAFLFYPEPYTKPGEIFYCRFDGPFTEAPSSEYIGAGYELEFTVVEIE